MLPVGVTVETPPPTVDMTTRPTPFVVVISWPAVTETELLFEAVLGDAADEVAAA